MFEQLPWYFQFITLVLYYTARSAVIAGFFFYLLRTKWGQKRKVTAKPYSSSQISFELKQTLAVLTLDSVLLILVLSLGLFNVSNLNIVGNIISFLVMLIWVEVTFYASHRLLHRPLFWKMHITHHRAKVPSPLSGFTFSISERFILFFNTIILVIIADALGYPLSMTGIQVYFILNLVLTVMGHSDMRIYPLSWRNLPLLNYISDPTDHSVHHARSKCNYGLFTNFLDKKLGTYRSPES